jgi:septal ring factor EnvC (AmiA/AmiB activator)
MIGKRWYFFFWSVVLLALLSHTAYCKSPSGTIYEQLREWRLQIENLKANLETYKQQLIQSEKTLREQQAQLELLQAKLDQSSQALTTAFGLSNSLSNSLAELRESLAAQIRECRLKRIKAALGGVSLGIALGAAAAWIIFMNSLAPSE